jgi:ligand-binding sensor protein
MKNSKITLQDILDIEHLQRLQDTFAGVASITAVVVDPEGAPITELSHLYGVCKIMQESEAGVQKCLATHKELVAANVANHGPAVLTCPHSGLVTAAIPIFLEDEYLGSWILGQSA